MNAANGLSASSAATAALCKPMPGLGAVMSTGPRDRRGCRQGLCELGCETPILRSVPGLRGQLLGPNRVPKPIRH